MQKLLIIDNEILVRSAMIRVIEDETDFQVIDQASAVGEILDSTTRLNPDIIMMDLNLPDVTAIMAIGKLKQHFPGVKIVIYSSHTMSPIPSRLMELGAAAVISKQSPVDEVRQVLTMVQANQRGMSKDIAQQTLASDDRTVAQASMPPLSTRELQVTMLLAQGLETKVISKQLSLSPKTISTYRYRIFEKFGIRGNLEFAQFMLQRTTDGSYSHSAV